MKEEYSWFADRSLSLETEFEQTKQNLVNTELDLKEERRKREIESEKWEMETRELERELQLCQSRLKQMGTDRAIQNKPSTCETQTQTVTMQQLDWIETEKMEEERHSLEKSLHDKEVEFESERRKLKEELEQAHDKLKQQELSHKTFLQEHLEELRVFKEFIKDQVAVRKSLEKQISEILNQSKQSTSEMQTQTVEQTKLKISEDLDMRETSDDQPLDKTLEQKLTEKESDLKKIEVLELQLQEFEDIKEEYVWAVNQNQSLEMKLEQTKQNLVNTEQDLKEERRKREIESEKWEMETRELERELQLCQSRLKQRSEDLDTRETSEDQPLDTRETSEDQPASKEESRGLQGNLKNLTRLFEEIEEQDMQKQGSCLKRDGVKGKNVAALMKMFEQ
uniref:Uncharacterized protein n=1 Tax=Knipowitschia caucasica TaxID=637954 RepID=A0AAV2LJF8_KNICA